MSKRSQKKKEEPLPEVTSDIIRAEDVQAQMRYSLDRYTNVQNHVTLMEYFRQQQEYGLVLTVGKEAQDKLKKMEEDRVSREIRLQKIAKVEKQIQEKQDKEKKKGDLAEPLTEGETRLWKWIQLEKRIVSLLPNDVTLNQNANFGLQVQISKIMIGAVLDSCADKEAAMVEAKKEVDDVLLDSIVLNVIHQCIENLMNPEHLKDLAQLMSAKGKFDLALEITKKAQERIQAMRDRLEKKIKLDTQLWALQEEEKRLKEIKKELTEQQKSLMELHKKIKQLPVAYSFDPQNMNTYDRMSLDLTKLMLKIAMDFKQAIKHKKKLVEKKGASYTKKERLAVADDTPTKTVNEVLKISMQPGNVEDPFQLAEIAEQLFTGEEWLLVYPVIDKARERVGELQQEFKQRMASKERLREAQKERADLLKEWKLLPAAKKDALDKLEFDDYVFERFTSNYHKSSLSVLDDLDLKLMKLLVDNMMTHHKEKEVEYDSKAKKLLDSIEKPLFLYNLAKHIERNWKNANDAVIKFGEKCQNITRSVEDKRQRRAPITKERDELKAKIDDLERRNRDVAKSDRQRLQELEKQLESLPAWPEYAKLDDPYQYDELNLDVVRVMISAILNNKVLFEERVAKMRREHDPATIDNKKIESDREKIHRDIQEMVKQCLERFANPSDLLKVIKDMKSRQEVDLVLQISKKCLQRITDIDVQRNLRSKIVEKLEEAKKSKDNAQIREQEGKLAELPIWPHYAKLDDPAQYNGTKFQVVQVALDAVLEHQDKVEANITHQYYMDKKGVDEKKIKEQREAMEHNISQVVNLCNGNIKDAHLLFSIAKKLSQQKQASILLKVAPAFFEHVRGLDKIRLSKERRDAWFKVLSDEKAEQQRIKKDLSKKLEEERASIEKTLEEERTSKKKKYPDDMGDANAHEQFVEEFTALMVDTTFATNEKIQQTIKDDKEKDTLTDARVKYLQSRVEENSSVTIELICKNVFNPIFINELSKKFSYKEQYKVAIKLSLDSLEKLDKVVTLQEKHQSTVDRETKLEAEKADLDKRRRKLTKEQSDELRQIKLDLRVYNVSEPNYVQSIEPQELVVEIGKQLIQTMQKDKTPAKEAGDVVTGLLRHITDIQTLIEFARYLHSQTEYTHAVKTGKKCEDHINALYKDLEKRENIKKRVQELEEERLRALATSTAEGEAQIDPKLKERLESAKKELELLPEIEYDKAKLDSWTLEVSQVIIDAAKIEDDDETLREQTVLAFKIDTSTERWDMVRNMVSDENWQIIKKELVVYVLQRDDNPVDKIELLMKDGLFEHCIKLFPPATGSGKELDLLLRLWREIEENEPKWLEQFIPIATRYMKRYYQEHKYQMVDPLLDKVSHWFPSVAVDLYKQACDMVLLWILPSQYSRFCEAMKRCKKRLVEDLKRPDDWDDLVRDFKRQHYGKRKLLQMLLAVVDDPDWNLESVLETKQKKGT